MKAQVCIGILSVQLQATNNFEFLISVTYSHVAFTLLSKCITAPCCTQTSLGILNQLQII